MAALTVPHALVLPDRAGEAGAAIESLAATPHALARALGWWDGYTTYRHGAMGPSAALASRRAELAATPWRWR